ncbi:hypothetical protein ACCS64_39540, partial [Rhizobium ruizarguesonis]
ALKIIGDGCTHGADCFRRRDEIRKVKSSALGLSSAMMTGALNSLQAIEVAAGPTWRMETGRGLNVGWRACICFSVDGDV